MFEVHSGEGEELEIAVHPVLADGEKRTIFIVQDESLFYTNDSVKLSWLCVNENELCPKASGRALHVSGFKCECHGFMKAPIDNVEKTSYKIIKPGKNNDGYWSKQIVDIDSLNNVFTS